MAGPSPAEQGRNIGKKVLRGAGLGALFLKAAAGGVEGGPPPNQVASNRGSDRPGISAQIPDHTINTLGKPYGKNAAITKGKGKIPSTVSSVTSSIPPTTIEGKYTSDRYQPDNGQQNVVFTNTRGGKNIGPDSAKIAEFRATAGSDWSAPPKNNATPKTPPKIELPVLSDEPPDLLKGLEKIGLQALEAFLDGSPILAACEPIPNINRTPTKEAGIQKYPTLTPDPTLSDKALSIALVRKLSGAVSDISPATPTDAEFILGYMGITGEALRKTVGAEKIPQYKVIMPITRGLLDQWEKNNSMPSVLVTDGKDYFTLAGIKIGQNLEYRLVRVFSDAIFTADGTIILPGKGINSYTGKPQADRQWGKNIAMFYDGTNLPTKNGRDITSELEAFAPQLATAARKIFVEDRDAILSVMASERQDGKTTFVVVDQKGNVRFVDEKAVVKKAPPTPQDMRGKLDDHGNWIWERQGPAADSEWQTIAMFNPVTGVMENVAAAATATPTLTPTPRPTETPTATATPEITPIPLPVARSINIGSIPNHIFGKDNVWQIVNGVLFGNAGVVGKETILERLDSYPGFEGPVVHVNVLSPSPRDSMQRSYIAVEGQDYTRGPWAAEKSILILQAPNRLQNNGWYKNPIDSLISVGWHPNGVQKDYRMVAGIRLLTDNGEDYFVTTYTINIDGSTIDGRTKVPIEIGEKQILRPELFYKEGKPYFKAFIRDSDPNAKYVFIGEMPLDETGDNVIEQYITWLGNYPGRNVTGIEVIEGELKIFK